MQSLAEQGPGIFDVTAVHSPRFEGGARELSLVAFLPKAMFIIFVLALIVDGAIPQLQMTFTGGAVSDARPLTWLMVTLVFTLLMKGHFQSSSLLPITVAIALYLLAEGLYLHLGKDISYRGIRSSLNIYTMLVVVGFASSVPMQIKSSRILISLTAILWACLTVSAAQFFTNSPVLRTQSNDSAFHVQAYDFFGQTRAFSLFTNAMEAGFFYCFMGGVGTSMLLRRGSRRIGLLLFVVCALGCYATYTRLMMAGFVVTTLCVFILSRRKLIKFRKLLPLCSLLFALLLIGQGLRTAGGAGRSDLASVSSLDNRIMSWGIYVGKFLSGSRADLLFGIGQAGFTPFTAPDRLENAAPIPIDNAYLQTLLGSGLSGMFLLVVTYCYLWSFLIRRVDAVDEHLVRGVTGTFATLPFLCCINDLPGAWITPLIFVVCLRSKLPADGSHALALNQSAVPKIA